MNGLDPRITAAFLRDLDNRNLTEQNRYLEARIVALQSYIKALEEELREIKRDRHNAHLGAMEA